VIGGLGDGSLFMCWKASASSVRMTRSAHNFFRQGRCDVIEDSRLREMLLFPQSLIFVVNGYGKELRGGSFQEKITGISRAGISAERQEYRKSTSFSKLAVYGNMTAMVFHDAPDQG
jgi:hypothetical protein